MGGDCSCLHGSVQDAHRQEVHCATLMHTWNEFDGEDEGFPLSGCAMVSFGEEDDALAHNL